MAVLAAGSLSLAGCGGSDSGSPSADDVASDTQASETPDGSSQRNPPGPSGGPALDPDWPEEVWVPAELVPSTVSFNKMGEGSYMVVVGGEVETDFDELRDALIAGNGAPDESRDLPNGTHGMSYGDLVSASAVGFELTEDENRTVLIIRMAPD